MQLPFSKADVSNAHAVQLVKPTFRTGNRDATVAAHKPPSPTAHTNVALGQFTHSEPHQPSMPLDKAEPFAVVKQTISDLEEQGLLMLFDRHDQVAKRLTGNLIAAGVLQDDLHPSEREE